MKQKTIASAEEMYELGAFYARNAQRGDVFALVGELGAGKTQWSQGFVREICPTGQVSSPTFSILNEYREGMIPVFHFDFYRLNHADELLSLGWDEYLEEEGIVLCEWANLFPELIPAHACWIEIRHQPDGTRSISEVEKTTLELGSFKIT